MTIPTDTVLTEALTAFLHADNAHVDHRATELGALATDGTTWAFLCGALALSAAGDIRPSAPRTPGGFYGVDPTLTPEADPACITANQLVAAAANQDQALMTDILQAHLDAALAAGPTSIEHHNCARILSFTMACARTAHQTRCDARA